MTAAEAMQVLEVIRREEELRLQGYQLAAIQLGLSPKERAPVEQGFDRRLTALALALDALRRGRPVEEVVQ